MLFLPDNTAKKKAFEAAGELLEKKKKEKQDLADHLRLSVLLSRSLALPPSLPYPLSLFFSHSLSLMHMHVPALLHADTHGV